MKLSFSYYVCRNTQDVLTLPLKWSELLLFFVLESLISSVLDCSLVDNMRTEFAARLEMADLVNIFCCKYALSKQVLYNKPTSSIFPLSY